MPIERDLHELLHAHDLVIVPRFGGFLTHYRPARLDKQRQVVHPPSKDLSYNRNLIRTDGLLTDHVARREGIDHKQAVAVIEGEVDAWLSKLNRTDRLELARIGTFYRDREGNLQFDPDRKVNYLKEAFGLRPVPAMPIARVKPQPTKEPEVGTIASEIAQPGTRGRAVPLEVVGRSAGTKRFPVLAVAASVAVLSTVATWWLLAERSNGGLQVAGFRILPERVEPRYAVRTGPLVDPTPLDTSAEEIATAPDLHGVHAVPMPGDAARTLVVDFGEAPTETAPSAAVEPVVQPARPDSTAVRTRAVSTVRYHVIGGCFLLKENAEGYVADLQTRGFAAGIIDQKGGLFRVAIGSYPDRELAEDALGAVRKEEAPEAWLLKK